MSAGRRRALAAGAAALLRVRATAPLPTMIVTAMIGAVLLWAAVLCAMRPPWLGVTLAADTAGVRIVSVAPGGPAAGRLAPGDRITALIRADGGTILPDGDDLLADPDIYPTYAGYRAFFARQGAIHAALRAPVTLHLADGRRVLVAPAVQRPLAQLPWPFWALALFGLAVMQIGAALWAFRRGQPAARLVAITGFGYMISTLTFALYSTREWVLDPNLFLRLSQLNHLGNLAFSYAALGLLWHYPRRVRPLPVGRLLLLAALAVWTNEIAQRYEWPLHVFYLQYCLVYIAGVGVAWMQWRAGRGRPDLRAALQWFLLSVLVSIGAVMLLFFVPELIGHAPLIAPWAGQILLSVLFVGLVLGVLRFRLFDLERWWFAAWIWFLGGALVACVDLFLLYVMRLDAAGALSLSILSAAWIYFPARQWLWSRFIRSPSLRIETYLPMLLEAFFAAPNQRAFQERWRGLMQRIFDPLDVGEADAPCAAVQIGQSGLVLEIPAPGADDGRPLRLAGRSRGNRLFTRDDVALASAILALTRQSIELRLAHERGAARERERIARDLHDDVAPHLLTLVHRAATQEAAQGARAALQVLRESIYALNDPHDRPLDEVVAQWRMESVDRVEAAGGTRLAWHSPAGGDGVRLNSRQRINLARVLREAVTNALRHAAPRLLTVAVGLSGGRLTVCVIHDGQLGDPSAWRTGNGTVNMRTRIAELDGWIVWQRETAAHLPQTLMALWEVPLEAVPPSADG